MLESTGAAPAAGPSITEPPIAFVAADEGAATRSALSIEHLLYAGVFLLGIVTRFLLLGEQPLAPFEAAQAWPAWLAATATNVAGSPAPQSALLYGLQSWTFFVFGANDALARLFPALLGALLVLLPWFWRSWIGRPAALVAALLFAVDPWLVAFGRASDGAGLALFFGLLALTALWQRQTAASATRALVWERIFAVAGALLLVSGAQAWSFVPVLAFFFLLLIWPQDAGAARRTWRCSSLIWFVVALVLGATGLLARPEAVTALGRSLSGWISQLTGPGTTAMIWPWLRLVLDQPLLAIFGPAGILALALWPRTDSNDRRLALFLLLWVLWGALLLALPARTPFELPMLGLPLAIGTALAIGRLFGLQTEPAGAVELGLLIAVAAILVISSVIWFAGLVESTSYDVKFLITALVLVLFVVGMWIAFGFWAGWRLALKYGGLFFACVLFLTTVRSSWQLNQEHALTRPSGFYPVTTLAEIRLLVDDIERLSSMRRGDPTEAEVQVVTAGRLPDPVLGWNLRELRNLRWTMAPETAITSDPGAETISTARPFVVTAPGAAGDPALAGYLGSEYGVSTSWDPAELPALPPVTENDGQGLPADELQRLRDQQVWTQSTRPRLEWLLYRNVKTPPNVQQVTLWVTPQ